MIDKDIINCVQCGEEAAEWIFDEESNLPKHWKCFACGCRFLIKILTDADRV